MIDGVRAVVIACVIAAPALAHAGGAPPTAVGTAAPDQAPAGTFSQLAVTVTPGTGPASTGLEVRCDLSMIGDGDDRALFDDGAHGDGAAGDLVFGRLGEVFAGTPLGAKTLPCLVRDAELRTSFFGIALTVVAACGDDTIQAPEACDDGGTEDADGCSATCAIEDGWTCAGEPSDCAPICDDGLVVGDEGCDDLNDATGDGCVACQLEPGWVCSGEPSTCVRIALCGNGWIEPSEQCDDANAQAADGCDATCQIELGYACEGRPSLCCDEGDAETCFTDTDGDTVFDVLDNCVRHPNRSQLDTDDDGEGDACDRVPTPPDSCCGGAPAPSATTIVCALLLLLQGRRRGVNRSTSQRVVAGNIRDSA
jgi:cysteine-rich repeat protein